MPKPNNSDTRLSLVSGALFDFDDPAGSDVTIDDVATALSNICRFCGNIRQFYSVAQHSVNASFLVPEEHALTALLHEISEPFLSDIPSPVKWRIPDIRVLAHDIEEKLAPKFGYIWPYPDTIKVADMQMMKLEKEHVKRDDAYWAYLDGVNTDGLLERVNLRPMMPPIAKEFFLWRYRQLTGTTGETGIADLLRQREANGQPAFFAWTQVDEEGQRTWLQAGNC